MGGRIAFIFALVIVLGVGLYIYNAGFLGKGFNLLESIAPLSTSSYSLFPQFPSTPVNVPPGNVYVPPMQAPAPQPTAITSPSATNANINPSDIPPGFTIDDLSPYFHQIRFSGISPGYAGIYGGSSYGQVSLYAYPNVQGASIDVTGWEIKSNRGGQYVPQAVNIYDPLGLSPASDIWLKSGDVLNIYSSSAPVNLRLNECIGYLPNKSQFNPALPWNCPQINYSEIRSFSGVCQNYIMSLGGCGTPDFSSPQIPQYDYACREYLADHFSYYSCYNEHIADPNFLSNEVRVWIGSSPLDPYHDRVQLVDRDGLLVDYYTY